jgi:diaminopimelate decarboxylase
MDHFTYKKGVLSAEDVSLGKLADAIGTPFYCYSHATLERHFKVFDGSFKSIPHLTCFAVKANSNLAVLKALAALGAGADCVSGGEIARARAAGIRPAHIVFSGVGKTREEMAAALKLGIGQFNVESREELRMLGEEAVRLKKTAKIALRVNPDVDAGSHDKISTGRKTDKFGVAYEDAKAVYAQAMRTKGIQVVGISTHIGSQLLSLAPFEKAFRKIVKLAGELKASGIPLKRVDLGGGLGVPYEEGITPPHPKDYAAMIMKLIAPLKCELVLEPGRLICGNAGVLVSRVILVKKTPERQFVVLDAAMNDLIRPSLYHAHHDIVPVEQKALARPKQPVDVVGPVCETGDVFARQRELPALKEGDLVAFRTAGAYGAVMASTYNTRPLVPEVMVKGTRHAVIRPRASVKDLLALDRIPGWLS